MRLFTFEVGEDDVLLGAEWRGGLIDLSAAHATLLGSRRSAAAQPLSGYMTDLLAMGAPGMQAARDAMQHVTQLPEREREALWYPLDQVAIWPPIPDPGKILCYGMNYVDRPQEHPTAEPPPSPHFFAKLPNTIIGPGEPIIYPRLTKQLDYGVQLATVIGAQMKHVTEADALAYVAGYTILHDVTARDLVGEQGDSMLARNFDTFTPIGPCLVTADEIPDPANLRLRTIINGTVMQDASTGDSTFPLARILADLSRVMTLEPGDIVSTGASPGGGTSHRPPVFLQPGDVVTLEIEGIGTLENPVVAEP